MSPRSGKPRRAPIAANAAGVKAAAAARDQTIEKLRADLAAAQRGQAQSEAAASLARADAAGLRGKLAAVTTEAERAGSTIAALRGELRNAERSEAEASRRCLALGRALQGAALRLGELEAARHDRDARPPEVRFV